MCLIRTITGRAVNTFYVKASPPWTAGGGHRLPLVVGRAVPASLSACGHAQAGRCGGVQVCGAVRAGRYAVCAEPCAGCIVPVAGGVTMERSRRGGRVHGTSP